MKGTGWAVATVVGIVAVAAWLLLPAALESHAPCREATAPPRAEDAQAEAAVRAAADALGMPGREPGRHRTVHEYEPELLTWGGEWAWTSWTQSVEGSRDLQPAQDALEAVGFRVVSSAWEEVVMRHGGLEATLWRGIPYDRGPRTTSVTIRGGCRHPQPGEHAG